MDFNYIDGFVLIALAYSFYKGFSKGFVIVLASLLALILGVLGAIYFSDWVAEMLTSKTEMPEEYISISAFALTFMGIIVGVHLLAKIINQAVKIIALAPLNKIMGGVFSVFKTIVVLSVTFYIFDFVNSKFSFVKNRTLKESIAYTKIMGITEAVIPLIANTDWYNPDTFEEFFDDVKDSIDENVESIITD